MKITVYFDNIGLPVILNIPLTIGNLKYKFYDVYNIPVAEQLLYEQESQDELGDEIYIQNLVDIQSRGLWLQLRNPGSYILFEHNHA